MKKNFWEWVAYIVLFIWQILQNLIGIGFWVYFKIRGDLETIVKNKYSKVYRSKYMSGGISLGAFAFVSNNLAKKETAIRHEQGHMWDSKVMGPLYLFIVGIPSLLNAAFDFTECYYSFYCERWANQHAGIGVDKNCRLYIKDKGALD
jgi:hypothetical protein